MISLRSGRRRTLAVRASWSACSQGGTDGGELGRRAHHVGGRGVGPDRDHVVRANLVRGDVDAAAVDEPVAVADQLARLPARGSEAETHEHVVEPPLEQPQQVLAGDARLAGGLLVVAAELLLEQLVVAPGLLLLAQLLPVLRLAHAPAPVLAGRVGAALDAALLGQAALALEEQLLALAAALLALWARYLGPSDSAALAGPAAVVGLRGDVLDGRDLEPGRLERADRGIATRARALGVDLDPLEAVLHPLASGRVGRHLGGERGRLARALEAGRAGGLPADDAAVGVGDRHDRVVEARLDVGDPVGDVLLHPPAGASLAACGLLRLRHLPTLLLRRRRPALAGDAHPPRALAAARVGLRSLAPDRKAAAVAKAAVGADLGQPLDVLGALAAQVPLHLTGLDRLAKLHHLVVGQVLDVGVPVDAGVGDDLSRGRVADPVDVREAHLDALVERDVYASDPSQVNDLQAQPCRCLWRGFEQITRTTPRRRITRQRSHIGFTDARTFIALELGVVGASTKSYPITFRRRPTGPMNRARGPKRRPHGRPEMVAGRRGPDRRPRRARATPPLRAG